jgi:hypothetical protein
MMGNDVIPLRNMPTDLTSDVGHQWVADCCRAGEGLITDKELSEKWELSPADWRAITRSKALERAIRSERERRVRSGQAAKEAATKHLVKGVGIVDQIMTAADTHPKHKLDAFRELRSTASVGADAEGRQDSTRFIIRIDLSADVSGTAVVEHYNKSIEINPNGVDPDVSINLEKRQDGKNPASMKLVSRDEHHGDE